MGDVLLGEGRFRAAQEKLEQALSLGWAMPGNMELVFWGAASLASAGRLDDALPLFRQAFDADPAWRELVPRLVVAGRLPDEPEMIERIQSA